MRTKRCEHVPLRISLSIAFIFSDIHSMGPNTAWDCKWARSGPGKWPCRTLNILALGYVNQVLSTRFIPHFFIDCFDISEKVSMGANTDWDCKWARYGKGKWPCWT